MEAVDHDKGQYGKIKYSIVTAQLDENNDDRPVGSTQDILQYFIINEDTGVIRVTQGANLDRESGLKELNFQVSAADNPSTSDDSPVNHRLTPKNQLINTNPFSDDLYSEESITTDSTHQSRSFAFANVHIKILDLNDNAPKFKPQTNAFKIYDYSDINKEYNFYSTYFMNPKDESRNFVSFFIHRSNEKKQN